MTAEEEGARELPVLTTGHDKARITVMRTVRSDGVNCKPFVVLRRKRPNPKTSSRTNSNSAGMEIDIEGDKSENSSSEDSIVRFKNEERDDTYPTLDSKSGFWRTFGNVAPGRK